MKLETKYSIGDVVYHPQVLSTGAKMPCPDCLGRRVWIAKLPNGEELRIACPTCAYGYEGSRGEVPSGEVHGRVDRFTIGSVRMDTGSGDRGTEYMCEETGVGSGSLWAESKLFDTREEAEAALPALIEEMSVQLAESNARNQASKRARDTGSMTAHYRAQIRRAKKDIAAAECGLAREAAEETP